MTPKERLEYLLETVTVSSGHGLLTNSALGDLTSPEVAEAVYDLIKAATESYAIQYVVSGIDTSTAAWKARVDGIKAPPELDSVKALIRDWELSTKPRWKIEGYQTEPLLVEIMTELALDECDAMISTVKNELLNQAEVAPDRTKKSMAAAYRNAAEMMEGV
jgi:hypothetical protein